MHNASPSHRSAAARASTGRCTAAWLKNHQDLSGTPAGALLTLAFPGWDGLSKHPQGQSIEDVAMQWDLTGALPLSTSPVHGSLGTLVETWTDTAETGSLDPVTWALLDRHAPGWCNVGARRNLVRQRANHWSGFRAVHGRDPKESSSETSERSLAGWVRRLRSKARRGTLTAFEDTLLSMLIPEWRESA